MHDLTICKLLTGFVGSQDRHPNSQICPGKAQPLLHICTFCVNISGKTFLANAAANGFFLQLGVRGGNRRLMQDIGTCMEVNGCDLCLILFLFFPFQPDSHSDRFDYSFPVSFLWNLFLHWSSDCGGLCKQRCSLHSRPNLCSRACGTCCVRCKCVPPGTSGNREVCGTCYTDMTTHGNKTKCP